MGNWDNFYYEVHTELKCNGLYDRFNILIQKLSESQQFRHRSTREKWNIALKQLKNEN